MSSLGPGWGVLLFTLSLGRLLFDREVHIQWEVGSGVKESGALPEKWGGALKVGAPRKSGARPEKWGAS
jgi:hypothetical protein